MISYSTDPKRQYRVEISPSVRAALQSACCRFAADFLGGFAFLNMMLAASSAVAGQEDGLPHCATVTEQDPDIAQFILKVTSRRVPPVCIRPVAQGVIDSLAPTMEKTADSKLASVYLPRWGEILIANDLDMWDVVDRSFLVHEMVHAEQFAQGAAAAAPCLGKLESEAYAVQAAYIRAHGRAEDAFVFDLLSMLQGMCVQSFP